MKGSSGLGKNYPVVAAVTAWTLRAGWVGGRYLKEVAADETTLRFWQEIYDDTGKLVETHEKFPVDKGHQKV